MNTDHTRQRRKLTLIAVGMALLVLVGWFLATWLPQAGAHGSGPTATSTAAMESGDSAETSEPARSRPRKAQGDDEQIRSRIESLLNIKPNELAIISVPKAALAQCFRERGGPSDLETFPMTSGVVARTTVTRWLEGILGEGGPAKVRVSDQTITEYSGKGIQMMIEVTEPGKGIFNVLIEMPVNGTKKAINMFVFPGFAMAFQLPADSEEGIVLLIGKEPGPATATTIP